MNILAAVLYFLVAILLCVREWPDFWSLSTSDELPRTENYRFRANYMLCLIIGAYTEGFGLAMRLALRKNPHSEGVYIVMYLFVVLSVSPQVHRRDLKAESHKPCAFLAANYILLGRLVRHLDGSKYLHPLKARLVSRTFICSDSESYFSYLFKVANGYPPSLHVPHPSRRGKHFYLP